MTNARIIALFLRYGCWRPYSGYHHSRTVGPHPRDVVAASAVSRPRRRCVFRGVAGRKQSMRFRVSFWSGRSNDGETPNTSS